MVKHLQRARSNMKLRRSSLIFKTTFPRSTNHLHPNLIKCGKICIHVSFLYHIII